MRCEHIIVLFLLSQSKYLYKVLVLPFIKLFTEVFGICNSYLFNKNLITQASSFCCAKLCVHYIIKFYNFFNTMKFNL